MIRVPPIFKKPDEYYDRTVQTDEDRKSEIKSYILDSLTVVPKVLSLFCRKNYYSNAFCSLVYVYNLLDNIKDM